MALLALLPVSPVGATNDAIPNPISVSPAPLPLPTQAAIGGAINVPPASGGLTGAVSSATASGPLPGGAAALAALGDPSLQVPGGDPVLTDSRPDQRQGPNEDRGMNEQSREFDRQQYVITAQMFALDASQDAQQAVFAGGGSGQFAWPERYRTVSQGFGCTSLRLAPTSSNCPSGHFHTGLDVAGPNLADVFAADTGIARLFHGTTGYGSYVIITHGNGYSSLYGHLHDVTVTDGQLVQRGDQIAHEGTTGNSTGPHLHFEVRREGGYLDPCPFLQDCRGH